jgi:CheY-like chemotaxis protein
MANRSTSCSIASCVNTSSSEGTPFVSLSPPKKKATVLIVEDDHALRELYRVTVMDAGYAVVAVEDGIDALRYIEANIPDLVLLDLGLPRLDGRDLQRELASHPETRGIPIVVVTGRDTWDLAASDFSGCLTKPVNTDALLAAIEEALSAARLQRAAIEPGVVKSHRPQSRTILVVDDEIGMLTFLTQFLEDRGYGVKTAGSVGEAIMVLEHSIIDAVILDVRMPRRSGLELLEFIRLDPRLRDFPVLVFTGAALTKAEHTLIARDADSIFYKSDNHNLQLLAARLDRITG